MLARIIGPGRAGTALAGALAASGWTVDALLGRGDEQVDAAGGADLLVVATPDSAVAEVAAGVRPVESTVVAHMSGAMGPEVLAPHGRRAGIHPLVSLATGDPAPLLGGTWFAVFGDPLVESLVGDLGGRLVPVDPADRVRYHAAAVVASNHLVALMGQVQRIAATAGVPLEAFLDLAEGALGNVRRLGPAAALTGPAARGDEETLAAHLAALDPAERAAYEALAAEARRLAGGR